MDQPIQKEAQQEGAFLQKLLRREGLGTFLWNMEEDRWQGSDHFCEILGLEKSAPERCESWQSLLLPESRPRVEAHLRRILAQQTPFELDCPIQRPSDGQIRWLRIWGEVEQNPAGRPVRMRGTVRDMTGRRQAEEGHRHIETLFRLFLEHSPIYVYFKDETIRATHLSRNFEVMLGRPLQEILGKPMDELFPPEIALPMMEDDRKVLREGLPVETEETLNGRWYTTLKFPIRQKGKPDQLAGFTIDITDRKHAEMAMHEATQRFRLAAEAGRFGVWERDLHTGKSLWDNRMFEIFGCSPESFDNTENGWHKALHPEDAPRVLAANQAAAQGKGEYAIEFRILTPHGTLKHIRSCGVLIRDEAGQPSRLTGISQDITEMKEAEEERQRLYAEILHVQKLESLGSLAGGVAHDMNNILAAIQGMASVIELRNGQDPSLNKAITTILHATERGRKLVKNLTDFARKGMEEPHPIDLNKLIEKEIDLLKGALLQGITLTAHLAPDLPRILGEPSTLGNVLMNLCINAMDAMPQGGSLEIRTRTLPGSEVELTVADTGTGMLPDVKAKALEPFFTTKPVGKGTGLGLSMAYGILKSHGGTITIQSEPGQGTTIFLKFPALPTT